MGGSIDAIGITGSGVQEISNHVGIRVDASQEGIANGCSFIARVYGNVESGGSVTPEVCDVTTLGGEVLVEAGSAITATTETRQSITVDAHSAGGRLYELRANKGNALPVWLWGTLERSVP
jgi:hypothetical protein